VGLTIQRKTGGRHRKLLRERGGLRKKSAVIASGRKKVRGERTSGEKSSVGYDKTNCRPKLKELGRPRQPRNPGKGGSTGKKKRHLGNSWHDPGKKKQRAEGREQGRDKERQSVL